MPGNYPTSGGSKSANTGGRRGAATQPTRAGRSAAPQKAFYGDPASALVAARLARQVLPISARGLALLVPVVDIAVLAWGAYELYQWYTRSIVGGTLTCGNETGEWRGQAGPCGSLHIPLLYSDFDTSFDAKLNDLAHVQAFGNGRYMESVNRTHVPGFVFWADAGEFTVGADAGIAPAFLPADDPPHFHPAQYPALFPWALPIGAPAPEPKKLPAPVMPHVGSDPFPYGYKAYDDSNLPVGISVKIRERLQDPETEFFYQGQDSGGTGGPNDRLWVAFPPPWNNLLIGKRFRENHYPDYWDYMEWHNAEMRPWWYPDNIDDRRGPWNEELEWLWNNPWSYRWDEPPWWMQDKDGYNPDWKFLPSTGHAFNDPKYPAFETQAAVDAIVQEAALLDIPVTVDVIGDQFNMRFNEYKPRKPAKGQVHIKPSSRRMVTTFLGIVNGISEARDLSNAAYWALPQVKTKSGKSRPKYQALNDWQRFKAVIDHHDEVDAGKMIENVLKNNLGDMLAAGAGKAAGDLQNRQDTLGGQKGRRPTTSGTQAGNVSQHLQDILGFKRS